MKKIFSKKIAYELRKKHFKIVGTEPNMNRPELDVYLFQDSDELEAALDEILKNRK